MYTYVYTYIYIYIYICLESYTVTGCGSGMMSGQSRGGGGHGERNLCQCDPPRVRKVKQNMQRTLIDAQSCSLTIGKLFSLPSATLFREKLGSYRGDQMSAWGRISRQMLKVWDLLSYGIGSRV